MFLLTTQKNFYFFHQKSINQIVEEYSARFDKLKDKSGKRLYELIDEELRNRGRNRNKIIEIVLNYLLENRVKEFKSLIEFLKQTLI